jgi:hypothetical protein
MRKVDDQTVELLVDPWGEYAAVWQLNPKRMALVKIRDFGHYRDREYTENIEW